jgi:plastin-1
LVLLLNEGETPEDLLKLSQEDILVRWVNYHLKNSDYNGALIKDLSNDIKDSIAYTYLLKQITPIEHHPKPNLDPLKVTSSLYFKNLLLFVELSFNSKDSSLLTRAERMLEESDKLKAREFLTPTEVVNGNKKLNTAYFEFNKFILSLIKSIYRLI